MNGKDEKKPVHWQKAWKKYEPEMFGLKKHKRKPRKAEARPEARERWAKVNNDF